MGASKKPSQKKKVVMVKDLVAKSGTAIKGGVRRTGGTDMPTES